MHRPTFALAAFLASIPTASTAFAQTLLQEQPIPVSTLPVLAPLAGQPIVAKDLDGDGDEDLVVRDNAQLVILRQQGGTFTREVVLASTFVTFLAAEDFDSDGAVDLLIGPINITSFQLGFTVYWGNGTGHFPTAATTTIPILITFDLAQGAVADLDQDGDLDMVLTAPGSFSGLMYRNGGNRTFTEATPAQYPSLPVGTATPWLVDVDGDGWNDVVLVSRDGTTRLYWNSGGTFTVATTAEFPLLQSSFRGFAHIDVDADGDLDLVLGGSAGPGVLLRKTAPRQLQIDPAPFQPLHVVALHPIDEDGDGDTDLHVFSRDRDELWRNDGTGSFTFGRWYGGIENVHSVVRVDLDDDGDPDFLRIGRTTPATGLPQPTVTAAWNVAPGKLEYDGASRWPVTSFLAGNTGDIDGDGLPDLLVGNGEPTGSTIQFASNDGRGLFAFHWAQRVGGIANGFFADLTGDGRDEYVFTVVPTAYLANSNGELATTSTPLPVPTFGQITVGAGVDIDGDSDRDLILVRSLGTNCLLCVLMNNGTGWTDESATRLVGPPIAGQSPKIRIADLDGDGDPDVWLRASSEQQIWRNQNGVLTFVPNAIAVTAFSTDEGAVADLDGDGDVDLHAGVRLWLNNGNGTFVMNLQRVPNTSENGTLAFSADLDDDGDLDLVGQGTAVWNNGAGFFTQATNPMPFAWGSGNGVQHMLDVDRDGDPDVISSFGGTSKILINQLRQFDLQGFARVGGSIALHYRTRPGEAALPVAVWYCGSFGEIPPTYFPDVGWLRIDVTQAFFVGPSLLPASGGDVTQQIPLPVDPTLIGRFFTAQPLELRGGRLRLGGFASGWIRQ